jgi:hypothetical protein
MEWRWFAGRISNSEFITHSKLQPSPQPFVQHLDVNRAERADDLDDQSVNGIGRRTTSFLEQFIEDVVRVVVPDLLQ